MQQIFPGNQVIQRQVTLHNGFRQPNVQVITMTPGSHIPQKVAPQSHIPQAHNNSVNYNRPPQNMSFQPQPNVQIIQNQPPPQMQFQPQPQPQMQFQAQPQRNPGPPFQSGPPSFSQGFATNMQPMNQPPMGPGYMGQPQPQMQFGYNQPQNPMMMQPNINQPSLMQNNGFGFPPQGGPGMYQGGPRY